VNSWQLIIREFVAIFICELVAMKYIIFVFDSTHRALKADKLLTINGLKFDVIPTPKEITSDCGISIRINPDLTDPENARQLLTTHEIIFRTFENQQNETL